MSGIQVSAEKWVGGGRVGGGGVIDKFHLQLQNLLYEVMHLEKEITKCLEFK